METITISTDVGLSLLSHDMKNNCVIQDSKEKGTARVTLTDTSSTFSSCCSSEINGGYDADDLSGDSFSSLDDRIPSIHAEQPPIIHYLGQEFKADELSHSMRVLQDSTIISSNNNTNSRRKDDRRSNMESCSSSRNVHDTCRRIKENCASLSHNDDVNASWSAFREELPSNSNRTSRNRRVRSSVPTAEENDDSTPPILHRAATDEVFWLTQRQPTSRGRPSRIGSDEKNAGGMGSQSDQFAFSRRNGSIKEVPQTTLRRGHTTTAVTGYFSNLVGCVNTRLARETPAKDNKAQQCTEHLERWGYSSYDVLCVVQDSRVFAKLQRDLRDLKAVTNNIIKEKIHVFVYNNRTNNFQKEQPRAAIDRNASLCSADCSHRRSRRSSKEVEAYQQP